MSPATPGADGCWPRATDRRDPMPRDPALLPADQGTPVDRTDAAPCPATDLATLARHGRSFRWAVRLLAGDQLADAAMLYAACRTADDTADTTPDPALHAAIAGLPGADPAAGARP